MKKVDPVDLGYAVVSKCLTAQQCDRIGEALCADAIVRSRAGARHLMNSAVVADLAKSDGLVELTKEWLGGHAIPFRATLFEKSSETNWLIPWHQDTALPLRSRIESEGWGSWSEKAGTLYAHAPAWALDRVIALRVHLDDSGADNGPLRVLPGSHTGGILSDETILRYASTHQEVACLTLRGGVIAMRPLLIHASSKAQSGRPRRVLHIEYADSLDLGDGIQLAVV